MRRKCLLIIILCVLLGVLLTGYIWWYMPTYFLNDVAPGDVARIAVFNGTTGQSFTIEDSEDIDYIVTKIADVRMRKEEYCHVDGFVYSISFYDTDGERIDGFVLNGNTIRDGAIRYEMVYETDEDPLCFEYIKALEEAQRNHPTE